MRYKSGAGVETDIQEVLQSPYIFTSISKGKLAKNDQLLKAFGTKEIDTICKQILDKGEIQVSKEERNQQLQATFKDVVTILSEVAINPKTGHPLTSTLIENTLKASAFSLTLKEPAKKQALKALAHLQQLYPNEIARSQMRLKITCSHTQRNEVLDFLRRHSAYVEHDGVGNGDAVGHPVSRGASMEPGDEGATSQPEAATAAKRTEPTPGKGPGSHPDGVDTGACRGPKQDAVVNIRFLCCTKIYREVDHFVSHSLQPPGSLQLVSLNVKDAGNRGLTPVVSDPGQPPSEPAHLPPLEAAPPAKPDIANALSGLKLDAPREPQSAAFADSAAVKKSAFKCTNCKMNFDNAAEYRNHCKSEIHVLNNRLTLKGLPPVSPQEFAELELCQKNASMDD
ncbi:ribosome maturation protein SBDS [Babesia caballi]|uniref:Ribosome maturation protein SBDS n=1 Tax=Babesia caballi TaxID=5871 RepID=A0AAV4M219_BABCB|nr:ribosome maturation protein SBDS [Babesia caballi]